MDRLASLFANPIKPVKHSGDASQRSMVAGASDDYSCEFGSAKYYALCAVGGALSCGLTHTAVTPLDLVKCRLQVNKEKYKELVDFCLVGHQLPLVTPPRVSASLVSMSFSRTFTLECLAKRILISTEHLSILQPPPQPSSSLTLLFLPWNPARSECRLLFQELSQQPLEAPSHRF